MKIVVGSDTRLSKNHLILYPVEEVDLSCGRVVQNIRVSPGSYEIQEKVVREGFRWWVIKINGIEYGKAVNSPEIIKLLEKSFLVQA